MGLIRSTDNNAVHGVHCPWANVIFTHETRLALNTIWTWLEGFGLKREEGDLLPWTDWQNSSVPRVGDLAMAGRFGQWKYFWTDDCVLRGKDFSNQ